MYDVRHKTKRVIWGSDAQVKVVGGYIGSSLGLTPFREKRPTVTSAFVCTFAQPYRTGSSCGRNNETGAGYSSDLRTRAWRVSSPVSGALKLKKRLRSKTRAPLVLALDQPAQRHGSR